MKTEGILLRDLSIDPTNYRGFYEGIEELADSISEHGLLQNLVVVPREGMEGKFVVLAGNRRLLAIDKLAREGKWSEDVPIPCLIRDDDPWIAPTENLNRRDVAPWRIGFRYSEFLETGLTMAEVAGRLHVSVGSVSNHVKMSRGIHPKLIAEFEAMGHHCLSKTQYLAIAACVTNDGKPVIEDQRRLMKKFLDVRSLKPRGGPRKKRPEDHKEQVYARFRTLVNGGMNLPPHAHGFVMAVLQYLNGDVKRPKFPPRLPGYQIP
jgi:ParB family chromosome partitioning protein